MMPGTAHRAIDHQTFGQRAAVMRACRADGEQVITASGDQNRFSKRVTQEHFSLAHVFGLKAFFKIRSLKFAGCFSHRISFFVLTYESHRTDPVIVLEPVNIPKWKRANPAGA